MPHTVSSRGTMHQPSCNAQRRKDYAHKKLEALARAIKKLNHWRVHAIQQRWDSLSTTKHGHMGDGNIANGILLCLLKTGLSTIEIKSMIKFGGLQLTRLQKNTTNHKTELYFPVPMRFPPNR